MVACLDTLEVVCLSLRRASSNLNNLFISICSCHIFIPFIAILYINSVWLTSRPDGDRSSKGVVSPSKSSFSISDAGRAINLGSSGLSSASYTSSFLPSLIYSFILNVIMVLIISIVTYFRPHFRSALRPLTRSRELLPAMGDVMER